MRTLWDLIAKPRPASPPQRVRPVRPPAAARYQAMTRAELDAHGVRVRKWRSSMSGCAWCVYYHDGRVARLIEAPQPRGPMSAAVFLHEIGHHAIGLGAYKPRCLEEYHAWMWSLGAMERHGITITARVEQRVRDSLVYAIAKAQRRGLRHIPPELASYLGSDARS